MTSFVLFVYIVMVSVLIKLRDYSQKAQIRKKAQNDPFCTSPRTLMLLFILQDLYGELDNSTSRYLTTHK
jgi:hypothetical protein